MYQNWKLITCAKIRQGQYRPRFTPLGDSLNYIEFNIAVVQRANYNFLLERALYKNNK